MGCQGVPWVAGLSQTLLLPPSCCKLLQKTCKCFQCQQQAAGRLQAVPWHLDRHVSRATLPAPSRAADRRPISVSRAGERPAASPTPCHLRLSPPTNSVDCGAHSQGPMFGCTAEAVQYPPTPVMPRNLFIAPRTSSRKSRAKRHQSATPHPSHWAPAISPTPRVADWCSFQVYRLPLKLRRGCRRGCRRRRRRPWAGRCRR